MSILSSVTGIGINPFGKRKIKINPMKALGTALTVGSMGGFGPIAAGLSHIPGGAALLSGASRAKAALTTGKGALALGAGKRLLGGGGGGVPQVTRNGQPISLSDINPNMPGDPSAAPPGGGGLMDFLKGHAGDIAVGGLGAMDAANAARASKRQGQLQDEMLSGARETWAQGAPLRAAGRARLLQPRAPVDFNAAYGDPTNPFAQPKQLPAGAQPRLLRAG